MSTKLTTYDPKAVAEFGKSTLVALVQSIAIGIEANKLHARAEQVKTFISFEMTKAILDLSVNETEGPNAVDPYQVWNGGKAVEKLNISVLIHFGVLQRKISNDGSSVVVSFVDPEVANLYDYSSADKENEPEIYNARFRNRKMLNLRLSDGYKATCKLLDNKNTTDDMIVRENSETNETEWVIQNAPKEMSGGNKEVVMGARKPLNDKATVAPTMSGLVQLATNKHRLTTSKGTEKGAKQDKVKMAMTDAAFGEIANTFITAVNQQEKTFSPEMVKYIKAVKACVAAVKF